MYCYSAIIYKLTDKSILWKFQRIFFIIYDRNEVFISVALKIMKRLKTYINKYYVLIFSLVTFLLQVNNVYCNSQSNNPEKKESPFNYIIVDDLLDFIRSPYENIFSQHSVFAWTLPTIILFGLDNRLTHFYISEIETLVRTGHYYKP